MKNSLEEMNLIKNPGPKGKTAMNKSFKRKLESLKRGEMHSIPVGGFRVVFKPANGGKYRYAIKRDGWNESDWSKSMSYNDMCSSVPEDLMMQGVNDGIEEFHSWVHSNPGKSPTASERKRVGEAVGGLASHIEKNHKSYMKNPAPGIDRDASVPKIQGMDRMISVDNLTGAEAYRLGIYLGIVKGIDMCGAQNFLKRRRFRKKYEQAAIDAVAGTGAEHLDMEI